MCVIHPKYVEQVCELIVAHPLDACLYLGEAVPRGIRRHRIQAPAWFARVLTGLELASRDESLPSFGKHLRLVSGVSGGRVGMMYYLESLKSGELATDEELARVVGRAKESSLNEVVWGAR